MFKICDFWCTVWRNIWKAEVSICYALKSFKLQLRRIIRYIKHNLWHKNTWLWVLWSNHSAALRQLSAPSVCSLFECWAAVLFSSVSLFMCSLCLSLSPSISLSHGLRASVRWESLLAPELGPFRRHGRHSHRQHVGGKLRHREVRFTCFTFKLIQGP